MVSMSDVSPSRSRALWVGWITAAAALLVAAIAGIYAANLKLQVDDVELRLVDAVMKLQTSEQQLSVATAQAGAVRSNLALLSAPDVVDLKLTGKAPAPDASGRAFISRSGGLLFTATRLPPIPQDKTYQLWLLSAGRPVNAGVVRADEQGNATAAFDLSTDAPVPTGFAVSVEAEGGAESPTGALYLSTR